MAVHRKTREAFGLPTEAPKTPQGIPCNLCFHRCRLGEGEQGYCGVWKVQQGRLRGGGPDGALVSWYLDPLPTNCVADWVCPGGTGAGYPQFAHRPGPEKGYSNLAVFYEACNFNCLYCQNWHFKKRSFHSSQVPVSDLTKELAPHVACICFFGGDPGPQAPHALAAAQRARGTRRILRICWETNGGESRQIIKEMMRQSLRSGGCLKIDLKAASESVHLALCGVSNRSTFENLIYLASLSRSRPEPPALVVSTLLVPGYVDAEEILRLSRFLAELDPEIPWSLLAFYPAFVLTDLPTTSRYHAQEALSIARAEGLKRVRLGNVHLLSDVHY
ncbi:radical SAM protein [Thermosulfuriphilus sp.]